MLFIKFLLHKEAETMDIICYNDFMELYIEMNGMELH